MYGAKQSADANKYSAYQSAQAQRYVADTGLTKQQLDNMDAYELQKLINEGNLAVAQAKANNGTADDSGAPTYDQIMATAYQQLTSGTPLELSGVNGWDTLKNYLFEANGSKDWDKIEKKVEEWKKDYPDLMDNYLTNLRSTRGNSSSNSGTTGGRNPTYIS